MTPLASPRDIEHKHLELTNALWKMDNEQRALVMRELEAVRPHTAETLVTLTLG